MSAASRRTAIIVLTSVTAIIHLLVLNFGIYQLKGSIDLLFTLNGLGFFALLYAYLNDVPAGRKNLVRWALIAYTLVTILAWVVVNGDFSNPLGVFTKAVELLLVIVLWMDK